MQSTEMLLKLTVVVLVVLHFWGAEGKSLEEAVHKEPPKHNPMVHKRKIADSPRICSKDIKGKCVPPFEKEETTKPKKKKHINEFMLQTYIIDSMDNELRKFTEELRL